MPGKETSRQRRHQVESPETGPEPDNFQKSKSTEAAPSVEGREHRSAAGGKPEQARLRTRAKTLGSFLG